MKKILFVLLVMLVSINVFATAQAPDIVIYKSKKYALHNNPLEVYFEKNPGRRPQRETWSTGNYRGYIATYEVIDGELVVNNIEIEVRDTTSAGNYKLKSVFKEVFPDQTRVKIEWLTGLLVLPYGKLIEYTHMGYASTFKKYILLGIDKGNLKSEKKLNYKEYAQYRERQFEVYKRTEAYQKLKRDMKQKQGESDEYIDGFLREFVTEYLSIALEP